MLHYKFSGPMVDQDKSNKIWQYLNLANKLSRLIF